MNEIEKMYFMGVYDYLEKKPIINILYRKGYSLYSRKLIENTTVLQFSIHSDFVDEYFFTDEDCSIDFKFDIRSEEDFMSNSEWGINTEGLITPTSTKPNVIGSYRPDFLISFGSNTFVIEVDGHNFHEKTKEQVKRDNTKNRDYLKWGVIPIRFSGSEVYNAPDKCAKETFETLIQYYLHSCENEHGFIENVILPENSINS